MQGGKIIWLDLGMMGRISPREAELYMGIIRTIYDQDVPALTQTLLALGQYDRAPDQQALTGASASFCTSMSPCRWPIWTWACLWTSSCRS